jgi:hypothetical protein
MTSMHIRLDHQELAALDFWSAHFDPKFIRPQAIRFARRNQLPQVGWLSGQEARGASA